VTILRLRAQYGAIREDILEISLGNTLNADELQRRSESIHHKIQQFSERLPGKIQRQIDHALKCLSKQSFTIPKDENLRRSLLSALAVHMGLVQTRYLLQRAIFAQTLALPNEIIDSAREILNLMLRSIEIQGMFDDWPSDIASIVSCHAINGLLERKAGS
jgi:hypothetical protein